MAEEEETGRRREEKEKEGQRKVAEYEEGKERERACIFKITYETNTNG